ncbi:MAG: PQQ-binding-like beta-propeller repeat protein [Candidatus Eremiobacteraeota bacterium]|nr:PQQ-binding-like beta-propeller repeat protein [Candidatus Eremiobacteraeota bacterium]
MSIHFDTANRVLGDRPTRLRAEPHQGSAPPQPELEVEQKTYDLFARRPGQQEPVWKRTFPMTMMRKPTVLADETVMVFDAKDYTLMALNGDNGHRRWKVGLGDILIGVPALAGAGLVLAARAFGDVQAFDVETGDRRWSGKGREFAVHGQELVTLDKDKVRRFALDDGRLLSEGPASRQGHLVAGPDGVGIYKDSQFTLLDGSLKEQGLFDCDRPITGAQPLDEGFLLHLDDGSVCQVKASKLFEPQETAKLTLETGEDYLQVGSTTVHF